MVKKKSIKREALPVPQTEKDAAEILGQIGYKEREIQRINTGINDDIERVKAMANDKLNPIQEQRDQLVDALFAFAQSHRDELTENGKTKTVKWPTGKISWRMTPPKVNLRDTEAILMRLKELNIERFIRIKEEIDKELMLKESKIAQTVKGVSITQIENLIIEPDKIDLEIVRKINPKKQKREAM
ncbi:host-nuclease inhibitor Gam family protein [Patescibacteria group bacterium]|nr:host-nuclease inhibitor Gam family protein [Patescibacteria group bacterium]MBU4023285.1 host-nuclease inhibitor Gam family protein [Patescibacteria group bacterium]MBU4078125.1 host-nuclease inhibitor Gam family protein [Patescibacteria group bacterium]